MSGRTPTLFDDVSLVTVRPQALPRGLERFHMAHAYHNTYRRAFAEIRSGNKQTHWMWFIFPQMITVEGASRRSQYFAIADLAEAKAYLADPVLRLRLAQCTAGALRHNRLMFNHLDAPKLRRSMTLFAEVADDPTLLNQVLTKFFSGPDRGTLDLLRAQKEGTVGKYWEKSIRKSKEVVASVGQRPEQTEPWTRARVTSFVNGLVVAPGARRLMVDAWMADRDRAYEAGREDGINEATGY